MWDTKKFGGIYMRNRTGGEPGVHLPVRNLSNPIWFYGAATAAGDSFVGVEGCFNVLDP